GLLGRLVIAIVLALVIAVRRCTGTPRSHTHRHADTAGAHQSGEGVRFDREIQGSLIEDALDTRADLAGVLRSPVCYIVYIERNAFALTSYLLFDEIRVLAHATSSFCESIVRFGTTLNLLMFM